jgi:predicted double-glycine peptidase
MAWQWVRIDERPDDERVVRQFHEYGCGAACASMLLADRGISVGELGSLLRYMVVVFERENTDENSSQADHSG